MSTTTYPNGTFVTLLTARNADYARLVGCEGRVQGIEYVDGSPVHHVLFSDDTLGRISPCDLQPSDEASEPTDGDDTSEYADELPEHEYDDGMTDVEADADALASAGYGTDEDYGYYGPEDLGWDGGREE